MVFTGNYNLQEKKEEFKEAIDDLPWQRSSLVYSYGEDFMTEVEDPANLPYYKNLTKLDKLIGEMRVLEQKSILSQ